MQTLNYLFAVMTAFTSVSPIISGLMEDWVNGMSDSKNTLKSISERFYNGYKAAFYKT